MADVFTIKRHDTQPSLAATLSADGVPIAIPAGATVSFVMRAAGCADECSCEPNTPAPISSPKVNKPGVVVDGALGQVRYDWAAVDTDTAGQFNGEFRITLAGAITTYPSVGYISIVIEPDLL
ncbi:MAG: hypothetical protein ACO3EH_00335 [Ilumatobacteraceae bacterium]